MGIALLLQLSDVGVCVFTGKAGTGVDSGLAVDFEKFLAEKR
jgi:hypothetical protein